MLSIIVYGKIVNRGGYIMKKNRLLIVGVFIVFISLSLVGCGKSENTESSKFEAASVYDCESNPDYCMCRADRNVFPIDDVTLDFFYGWIVGDDRDIPEADGFFIDAENLGEFLDARKAGEAYSEVYYVTKVYNYTSEDYRCIPIYDEKYYVQDVECVHSEKLTIPRELFSKDEGLIYFALYGEDKNNKDGRDPMSPNKDFITSALIHYRRNNDEIILLEENFEYGKQIIFKEIV